MGSPAWLEDQALFSDIDSFMRSKGFWLRGLRRSYWRNDSESTHPFGGQIIHGDALYIRPTDIDCRKGHMILAAYQQYDLLAQLGATEWIPRRSIWAQVSSRLFRGVPNRNLRRLVDSIRPANASDWHDPDFF